MNFEGYFLKTGKFYLQKKHYDNETLEIYHTEQTIDSYTDGNGVNHESSYNHSPITVSWQTPYMRYETYLEITNAFKDRKSIVCEVYDIENDKYVQGIFKATIGNTKIKRTVGNDIRIVSPMRIRLEEY